MSKDDIPIVDWVAAREAPERKRIRELEATIAELREAASWSRDLLWRMQSGQVLDYNKAEIAQVIKAIDATLEQRVNNNALE